MTMRAASKNLYFNLRIQTGQAQNTIGLRVGSVDLIELPGRIKRG